MYWQRLQEIWLRVQGYPLHEVLLELGVLWIVVYAVQSFLRGTRGGRAFRGIAMILIVALPIVKLLSSEGQYERLNYLFTQFITVAALTLVIVFQPELRRMLVRLGEAQFFRGGNPGAAAMIEELLASVTYLSKNKVGAIIAIERQVALKGVVEAGTPMDAVVTRELLNTIFWPGSALHDMAVIIHEDRIVSAGVQLPLAEGERFSTELGSRHRAAIGLTQETDAAVIVVSEETGIISVAERGELSRDLTPDALRERLRRSLGVKKRRKAGAQEPAPGATEKPARQLTDSVTAPASAQAAGATPRA